nr:MAG: lysyl-tRNA synthetase, class II [Candidatus Nanosalinarum sp. J07AB56]
MADEREERYRKLDELMDEGPNPFPYDFERTESIGSVVEKFDGEEEPSSAEIRLAGRLIEIRDIGGLAFADLRGERDEIQLKIEDDQALETLRNHIHKGDIVGAGGEVIRTNTGELSLDAEELTLLTKGVRPMPSDYYGVEDDEVRYGDRALHLTSSMDARERLRRRSSVVRQVRNFLHDRDFMEVETPVLQPVYGGAAAEPFKTYVEDLDEEWYLRISPELYLKRLVAGGFERVFEVARDFRNESIDTTHNPEFTMLEVYQAYADYEDMMELTEQMIESIAVEVTGSATVEYQDHELDFSAPWERLTMREAIEKHADIDVNELSDSELENKLEDLGGELDSGFERGLAIAEIFEEAVEHELVQPVHIIDHPEETTPLCKKHRSKDGLIERFESFAVGIELSNAYTELRNPVRQRELFEEEERRQEEGDDEAHPIDMDFVETLELGMPPTGGLGIGIDRLVMLMTDSQSIKEVLAFPMVKGQDP